MKKAYVLASYQELDALLDKLQKWGHAHPVDVKGPFGFSQLRPVKTWADELEAAVSRLPKTPPETDVPLLGGRTQKVALVPRPTVEKLLARAKNAGRKWDQDAVREQLEDAVRLEYAKSLAGRVGHAAMVSFWFPAELEPELARLCRGYELDVEPPEKNDVPPTLLKNPVWVKPFEWMTTAVRVPAYDELDISPIVALSFMLFFGFMFADAGYGLALLAMGLTTLFLTTQKNRMLHDITLVLIGCAVSSVAFGAYFGEIFGFSNRADVALGRDLTSLLYVSIGFGLVHLNLSGASQLFGRRRSSGAGMMLFTGGILAHTWIPDALALSLAGLLVWMYAEGFGFFEQILFMASGIASYLRLGALAAVHIVFAQILAQSMRSALLQPAGWFIAALMLIVLGGLMTLFGAFLVFLQSLRLQWVEFFRFSSPNTGMLFDPLTLRQTAVSYT